MYRATLSHREIPYEVADLIFKYIVEYTVNEFVNRPSYNRPDNKQIVEAVIVSCDMDMSNELGFDLLYEVLETINTKTTLLVTHVLNSVTDLDISTKKIYPYFWIETNMYEENHNLKLACYKSRRD